MVKFINKIWKMAALKWTPLHCCHHVKKGWLIAEGILRKISKRHSWQNFFKIPCKTLWKNRWRNFWTDFWMNLWWLVSWFSNKSFDGFLDESLKEFLKNLWNYLANNPCMIFQNNLLRHFGSIVSEMCELFSVRNWRNRWVFYLNESLINFLKRA